MKFPKKVHFLIKPDGTFGRAYHNAGHMTQSIEHKSEDHGVLEVRFLGLQDQQFSYQIYTREEWLNRKR